MTSPSVKAVIVTRQEMQRFLAPGAPVAELPRPFRAMYGRSFVGTASGMYQGIASAMLAVEGVRRAQHGIGDWPDAAILRVLV